MKPSEPVSGRIWYLVLKKWWKLAGFISVLTLVWILASYFELLGRNFYNSSILVMSLLLYVLSLPVSLILRLDELTKSWLSEGNYLPQLIALALVWINFTLLGFVQGHYRGWKACRLVKEEDE